MTKDEVSKMLAAGQITATDASKFLAAIEAGDENQVQAILVACSNRDKETLQVLTAVIKQSRPLVQPVEQPKPVTIQEKTDIAFPSWLPWIAVIALVVLGIWWFNYSDHAQNVRDEQLMKSATISAEAMHRAPPRTKEEAVRILSERAQQLNRYIEKKYGPDAQRDADRERDDFDRDRQNDSYRE